MRILYFLGIILLIGIALSISTIGETPINFLIELNRYIYNYSMNTTSYEQGYYNISVNDSDLVDGYNANYFCPLNASACSGGAEVDPKWSANYTAFNNSWSITFNSTYDAKVSYNTSWNESRANSLYWKNATNTSYEYFKNTTINAWINWAYNKSNPYNFYNSTNFPFYNNLSVSDINTSSYYQHNVTNSNNANQVLGGWVNTTTGIKVSNDTKIYFGTQGQFCMFYNSTLNALVSTNVC